MADLSGFTALSERLARLGDEGAERLVADHQRVLRAHAEDGGPSRRRHADLRRRRHPAAVRRRGPRRPSRRRLARHAASRSSGPPPSTPATRRSRSACRSAPTATGSCWRASACADEGAQLFFLGRGAEQTALRRGAGRPRAAGRLGGDEGAAAAPGAKLRASGDFWLVGRARRRSPGSTLGPTRASALRTDRRPSPGDVLPAALRSRRPRDAGEGHPGSPPSTAASPSSSSTSSASTSSSTAPAPTSPLEQLQTYAAMLTRLCREASRLRRQQRHRDEGLQAHPHLRRARGPRVRRHQRRPLRARAQRGLRDSGLDLQHRIGVNGGHVFAGEVGPAFRRQYTVHGRRGEPRGAAHGGRAAPARSTSVATCWTRAAPSLCGRELPPIKVKGKEKPVAVCVLEEETSPSRHVHGWSRARVRRRGACSAAARSWTLIGARWEQVPPGRGGRPLLVEGDAGVGKTRLVEEALRELDRGDAASGQIRAPPASSTCRRRRSRRGSTSCTPSSAVERGDDRGAEHRDGAGRTSRDRLPDLREFGSLLNPLLDLSLPAERRGRLARRADAAARSCSS